MKVSELVKALNGMPQDSELFFNHNETMSNFSRLEIRQDTFISCHDDIGNELEKAKIIRSKKEVFFYTES